MPKVVIMLGSARDTGNGAGIAAWLSSHVTKCVQDPSTLQMITLNPLSPPHPLGPVVGTLPPAGIRDPADYPTDGIKQWSALVSSCDAFIVVTPQYNWGYPGELKTMFDHLYNEWRDKPIMIVTYGGHGGSKANTQLQQVFQGALHMHVVEPSTEITLPREYIQGGVRVSSTQPPEFLTPYEESIRAALVQLLPSA
jgi:NAD(P)H-dependent FMN reductase